MTIATLGAVAIGELAEAVAVMLFYSVGEYFQDRAVNRSRRSIAALLAIRPDYANIRQGDQIRPVPPEAVSVGEEIVVKPGERVPLDGVILTGASFVDTSALTGERYLALKATRYHIGRYGQRRGCAYGKSSQALQSVGCGSYFAIGGRSRDQKSTGRAIYYHLCPLLHSGGSRRCGSGGDTPAAIRTGSRVFHLVLPSLGIAGYLLPLCPGNFDSARLFWRYWQCLAPRNFN